MKNMPPLISVIIPCYNQARYLPDAISSLLRQSYKNWECIIINDGSQDDTIDVAEKLVLLDKRVKFKSQENKGPSTARNLGFKLSNGDFIQYLDADDMLENDKLNAQFKFLEINTDIDITFSEACYFTTENHNLRDDGYYATGESEPWITELWKTPVGILKKSLSHNLFPINCPLIRRSVFEKVGGWNEELEAVEDWEYWIRCALKNIKMQLLDEPNTLALIRMHNLSMTHDTPRMKQGEFKMRLFISPLLNEPTLRQLNSEYAFEALRELDRKALLKPLLTLVYANPTASVVLNAISFYTKECALTQQLTRFYKQVIPWPIQKFLSKLTFRS
ncbi:MAG: glycosyltransferase family 2 protein [Candidatus Reddybacter sp.]